MTNTDSREQLFITTSGAMTVGIRMDRILSFSFNEPGLALSIRYLDDPNPEKFEGPMAQAILRELRYAGRK